MSALTAYDMAHRGAVLEREACAVLNRAATHLGEQLADDKFAEEPDEDWDLMHVWETSRAAHANRPYDKRYRVLNGSPYYIRRGGSR